MTIEEKQKYYSEMLESWLDVAEGMLDCGAEVWRVERTIKRLADSRSGSKVNAFTINSNITITCTFEGGLILTQTRRIERGPTTDMTMLEQINALSRKYCRTNMDSMVLETELIRIRNQKLGITYYIGGAIAAGGFALFFGGGLIEGVLAAVTGLIVCLFNRKAGKVFPNIFMSNFVIAFLTGIVLYVCGMLIPGVHVDKSLIGVIMLLIPGIVITNALRDIIIGDTISGSLKFIESIISTIGIAIGYMAAMLITGGAA